MGCIRQYKSAITNQLFWQIHRKILTPCTQGCWRTWAALRRRVASRTNSLDMRSLAPSVMWAQSFSGNSYLPCWMLSNKWLWKENISQYPVKLKGLQNSKQHYSAHMQVFFKTWSNVWPTPVSAFTYKHIICFPHTDFSWTDYCQILLDTSIFIMYDRIWIYNSNLLFRNNR